MPTLRSARESVCTLWNVFFSPQQKQHSKSQQNKFLPMTHLDWIGEGREGEGGREKERDRGRERERERERERVLKPQQPARGRNLLPNICHDSCRVMLLLSLSLLSKYPPIWLSILDIGHIQARESIGINKIVDLFVHCLESWNF